MHTKTKKILRGVCAAFATGILSGIILLGIGEKQVVFAQPTLPNYTLNANANGSTATTSTDQQAQKELNTIIATLITVEKAFLALSIPLNIIIGKLLSNDWVYLDGDAYKAIETLWILMRNIVNVVFACLLLIIAIAQIAGAVSGSESKTFALKQALPGFIFGLIFVNFSLLACKVILDVGNLATTAAFSMVNEVGPNLIAGGKDPNTERVLINKSFCWPSKKALEQINSTCKSKSGTELATCLDAWAQDTNPKSDLRTCMGEKVYVAFGQKKVETLYKSGKISPESWAGPQPPDFNGDFAIAWSAEGPKSTAGILFGARNVMMVYTNSIFRMPEILTLYNDKTNLTVGTGTGILMTTLLTLIFGAMIILINIALVMALGIRMVLIWMILIFSPLMALEFVSDGKFVKGFLSKAKFDKGLLNGLIGLAFMPAIAGIVLSLGFIIFHVLNKIIYRTTSFTPEGAQTFNIPPFDIEITGSIMPMFSTLGEFIIACILLIILWQALFQMMQTNKYMDGAINKISKLGETIAGSAKLIPFIPMPGGTTTNKDGSKSSAPPKMLSWAGLNRGTELAERAFTNKMNDQATDELDGTWFGSYAPHKGSKEVLNELRELKNKNHGGVGWKKEQFDSVLNIFVNKQDAIRSDEKAAQAMADSLKTLGTYAGLQGEDMKKWTERVDKWYKNRQSPTEEDAFYKDMSKMLWPHAHHNHDLHESFREKRLDDNMVQIADVRKGTPPPATTGQPPSQATLVAKKDGSTPGKDGTFHIEINNPKLHTAPLQLAGVPQKELEDMWIAKEKYTKALVAKSVTPTIQSDLDTSLLNVLKHDPAVAMAALPAGVTYEEKKAIAEAIFGASTLKAPEHH